MNERTFPCVVDTSTSSGRLTPFVTNCLPVERPRRQIRRCTHRRAKRQPVPATSKAARREQRTVFRSRANSWPLYAPPVHLSTMRSAVSTSRQARRRTYPCQHARSVHALLRLNTPDFFVAFFFAWLFGAAVDLAPPASVVWLPFSKAARRAFWKSSSASVAVALCSLYILRMRLTPCAHIARYS